MLERELKLAVAREDLPKVFRLACVRRNLASRSRGRLIRNIYYDTPDFDLRQLGVELRVRRADERWLQTIKAARDRFFGLHERIELDTPLRRGSPDLAALGSSELPPELESPVVIGRIGKVFETKYRRTVGILEYDNGARIELCADCGEAILGARSAPICEIELELKRGPVETLFLLAEEIADGLDVRVHFATKPDLGYRLAQGWQPAAKFSAGVGVSLSDTSEEILGRILSECLRHALANEEAIVECGAVEATHQMRVGLRRFRSCLEMFRTVIPEECAATARNAIEPLLAVLGPARDWDVLVRDRIDRIADAAPSRPAFRRLEMAAAARREAAYGRVRERLQSREHHRMKLLLLSWVACRGWRTGMPKKLRARLSEPGSAFVRDVLRRGRRRVRRLGRDYCSLTEEQLHELRIAVKKHRYPVEFFAKRFEARRAGDYLAALKALQTDLGRVNDVTVARELLAEIGEAPALKPAIDFALERAVADRAVSLEALKDRWRTYRGLKAFWKKKKG